MHTHNSEIEIRGAIEPINPAVSPEDLQELLTDAIDEVLDIEAFNAEVDAEREDAAFLAEARHRACLALGDLGRAEDDDA